MNDVMSMGIHRCWKDGFVDQLRPHPGAKVLDLAGGTGDIAFRILSDFSRRHPGHPEPLQVTVCDINPNMLSVGQLRANDHPLKDALTWVEGNAECLPFPDNSFDYFTIAFGIRNVTHIDKALSEAYRVLKTGGRFMCLEFSHVDNPAISTVYDAYSFQVIPVLGQIIANDYGSYQYLVESIRQFPNQADFTQMIAEAGFSCATHVNYSFGVVAAHSAFKIPGPTAPVLSH